MPESPRPDSLDAIARRIRLLCAAMDLTQQAFADLVGISRTGIANYEGATRRPDSH
jgi:transcriptional regulator with XRE-family HTH domain